MKDFSILIGGKAGFGIDKSSLVIASIINKLGYRLYVYRDYPSLIRGGHTFSIIRASVNKISTHKDNIDCLLALNQDTVDFDKERLKDGAIVIYDSDTVKVDRLPGGMRLIAIPMGKILKETAAPEIMRNTAAIGALCKAFGISWDTLDAVFRKDISKEMDLNLKIARRGYDQANEFVKSEIISQTKLPFLTGNEALSLGLIRAGLKTYIAYPMTPTSPILHFMARMSEDFSIKVIHPESEIAVMLMACGASYCGEKVAVGTSGGGFCLMTEGFSFAGMAELPVVVVLGQRPGPSTGLPTYTAQTELGFALNAGQGEFTRFVVAPGDAEEAYYWSQVALNISWKYQIPSIILTDKSLGEETYSFDIGLVKDLKEEKALLWDRKLPYKRYLDTDTGVSPLTFVPDKDAVIKINSYEHDEYGITTEEPAVTIKMQDKRLRKEKFIAEELKNYETVKIYGKTGSDTAILCWGSNKGVCVEAAEKFGLKVIQPLVLSPFPVERLKEALKGVKKVIAVENNATAQLVKLINRYGIDVNEKILKYDGRPFSLEELEEKLKKVIK